MHVYRFRILTIDCPYLRQISSLKVLVYFREFVSVYRLYRFEPNIIHIFPGNAGFFIRSMVFSFLSFSTRSRKERKIYS